MGKGKDPNKESREHQSAPLSTLKDPASFGPPPKHIHYHSAVAANATSSDTPGRGGLSAPLLQEEDSAQQRMQANREAQARAEEEANKPPPGPYRVDTTGLSTANLPRPPVFRPGQATSSPSANEAPKPKPKLPPRLPPRQNSHPDAYSEPPPPPYSETPRDTTVPSQGLLNQEALNRLGNAGVSVPGLNIGNNASPPVPPRQNTSLSNPPVSPTTAGNQGPQLSELQTRFAKISTSPTGSQPSTAGTSWAEKQAALKTANNLRNDPSKVSLSDVRNATSTANNFRERHGEQAAAGLRAANGLNQKYGVADRVNSYASPASPASPPPPQSPTPSSPSGVGKKPPPPPPRKKKELTSNSDDPPPIPLASKPKF